MRRRWGTSYRRELAAPFDRQLAKPDTVFFKGHDATVYQEGRDFGKVGEQKLYLKFDVPVSFTPK